jgi:hypothetical protein
MFTYTHVFLKVEMNTDRRYTCVLHKQSVFHWLQSQVHVSMLYYRKQRKSKNPVTQGKAKHCAACCQKVTKFLTTGHELSTFL